MLLSVSVFFIPPRQQFARLGDFALENGAVIQDAVIGYRTLGRLNESKSNAVLVLPWFQGTSGQLVRHIGPGRLVDSSRYFVILADVFGNGVSSSPSNSASQPGTRFPEFTISDIVRSQHDLVHRTLQLTRLHAVVGTSMGGMQVFQWIAAYPNFVDNAVSIVGSPQAQADDKERCQGIVLSAQEAGWPRVRDALLRGRPRTAWYELRRRPEDEIRQARAMALLDISRRHDGSMERAAAAIGARLMVAGAWTDREVNPKPGFDFARLAKAEILELDGACGHQAPSCDRATLWRAVSRFLDR